MHISPSCPLPFLFDTFILLILLCRVLPDVISMELEEGWRCTLHSYIILRNLQTTRGQRIHGIKIKEV